MNIIKAKYILDNFTKKHPGGNLKFPKQIIFLKLKKEGGAALNIYLLCEPQYT